MHIFVFIECVEIFIVVPVCRYSFGERVGHVVEESVESFRWCGESVFNGWQVEDNGRIRERRDSLKFRNGKTTSVYFEEVGKEFI